MAPVQLHGIMLFMHFRNLALIIILFIFVITAFIYNLQLTAKSQVLGDQTHKLIGIGTAVAFASHQCDNNQPCSPVTKTMSIEAIKAIRAYANDPTLKLKRISEVNRKNLVYFCSDNDRCWSYDIKIKQVTSYM